MSYELVQLRVGTPGLMVAIVLYGTTCIIDYGSWLGPAIIRIPVDDIVTFNELHMQAIENVTRFM